MNITCDKCSYVISLSAEEVRKIPPGKQASVICPKCERKFSISFGKPDEPDEKDKGAGTAKPSSASEIETQVLEKEINETKKEIKDSVADALFGFVEDESPAPKAPEIKAGKTRETASGAPARQTLDDIISSDMYDASDKPFDFVEEEGKTALVCESDPKLKGPIIENLNLMEYHITEVENSRSALKKMRYHIFDVIVVNEMFDTNSPDSNVVLIYLERLNMSIRRNVFVALLSNRFRTMDNMIALQKSVDIVINLKNIKDVGKILSRGVTDKDFFYRAFKDALLGAGS